MVGWENIAGQFQESFRPDVWKNLRWSDTSKQSNFLPISVSVEEVLSLSITCFNF